ncbi:MAG: glycosyl hydrolase-related protein, partial [bacterium]
HLPTPREYEAFRLEPDNLIVTAFKKAERDESLILRFFETNGEPCRAKLKLPPRVRSAVVTDLLEREMDGEGVIDFHGSRLELDVRPFEIVTIKLEIDRGA